MGWRALRFRDIFAIFLFAVVVILLAFTARHPNPANNGFGPEWKCTDIPKGGGPICFKDPTTKPQGPN